MTKPAPHPPLLWPVLLVSAAVGLALRIAAADGGLWLDEAWSAEFARDVGTPMGVFLGIHHDNNHHLNTMWLQMVGFDAHPIVQRALSIASGTATIIVAGLIVARRGIAAAAGAAMLFAVSPILVTYGSEARGYAPMLLAFLIVVLLVGRWLAAPERPAPVIAIAVAGLIGTLSQLTMLFGLPAIAGWIAVRRWQQAGARSARTDSLRVMAAPFAVAMLAAVAILRWLPGAQGFRIGSYRPFTIADLAVGQGDLIAYTFGVPAVHSVAILAMIGVLAGIACLPATSARRALYALAIAGPPLGIAVLGLGNAAYARYFLPGGAAMLLLVSEHAGGAIRRGGWRGVAGIVALAAIVAGSTARNIDFIRHRRADPTAAVVALRAAAPAGATVSVDRVRATPVVEVAAAQQRYPVRITPCGAFLFVDRDGSEPFPAAPALCGARYEPVTGASPAGLSGTSWRLYRRM